MSRTFCLIAAVGIIGFLTAPGLSGQGKRQSKVGDELIRRYEAARLRPGDEEVRAAFLKLLPKVDDYYLLEGDLRMTEEEVIEYLIANGPSAASTQLVTPELVVNLHRGERDYYPVGSRTLTYFIDRSTFLTDVEFNDVAKNLATAAAEWECEGCGIRFVRTLQRGTPAPNFVVRRFDAEGKFVALGFYPHDPPARRTLEIDPSYFDVTSSKVGVFRHELGHILGYRHEQVRGVRGCVREDRFWEPLTAYDPKSVMHYFCGGAGNRNLEITRLDREGHLALYGPNSGSVPAGRSTSSSAAPNLSQPAGRGAAAATAPSPESARAEVLRDRELAAEAAARREAETARRSAEAASARAEVLRDREPAAEAAARRDAETAARRNAEARAPSPERTAAVRREREDAAASAPRASGVPSSVFDGERNSVTTSAPRPAPAQGATAGGAPAAAAAGAPRPAAAAPSAPGQVRVSQVPGGPTAAANAAQRIESEPVLVVSFEGGKVADEAAAVLAILNELKVLPLRSHKVKSGDSIEKIYKDYLGLPFHASAMTDFAGALNKKKDYSSRGLTLDETVVVPAVRFAEDSFGIRESKQQAQTMEKKWAYLVLEKGGPVTSPDQSVRIELKRFELRLPIADPKVREEAVRRIHALSTKNVIATIEEDSGILPRYFGGSTGMALGLDDFIRNRASLREGDQVKLLTLLGDEPPGGKKQCTTNCPEVILVDKRVSVHPDLNGAVNGEDLDSSSATKSLLQDGKQTVDIVDWQDAFHGTHLAGIIGARDNRFGLIGVDPDAQITAWNWDVLSGQRSRTAKAVVSRQASADNDGHLQIYTFATEWPAPMNATVETRTTEDILAKRLTEEKPLVIVAAGEAPSAPEAQEITALTRRAPVNLGDFPNVLVVTACTKCDGPNAGILPEAHYSKEFVHVAAPGFDLLSTVFDGKYSRARGTSQAVAYATGLASLMAERYPQQYREAYQLKVRMEVTSTPFELVGKLLPGRGLTAGILSPGVALLDPSKHWIKLNGVARAEVTDPVHTRNFQWSPNTTLDFEDTEPFRLEETWRLIRQPSPDGDEWVAYVGSRKGPIRKVGPAKLRDGEGNKVLFTLNGEQIKPSMFEDLILKYPSSGR